MSAEPLGSATPASATSLMAVAIWIVCADENWAAAAAMSALLAAVLPSACAVSVMKSDGVLVVTSTE